MSKQDLSYSEFRYTTNPIDLIEELILTQDWPYHRLNQEAIVIEIPGRWGDYRLQFLWQSDANILQLSCDLDFRIPGKDLSKVYELLSRINERAFIGHFEYSSEEGTLLYRYGVMLHDFKNVPAEYLEGVVDLTFQECERFYPAFEMALIENKSTKDAISTVMFDTIGEA